MKAATGNQGGQEFSAGCQTPVALSELGRRVEMEEKAALQKQRNL